MARSSAGQSIMTGLTQIIILTTTITILIIIMMMIVIVIMIETKIIGVTVSAC